MQLFATIPVTTASGEISYDRSTMGEERLNGLAQLYINRDIKLVIDDVIDDFSKFNRRLNFVLLVYILLVRI